MSERRQRVLLVTRNLPPLLGGMERLNSHLVEELAQNGDVHVIGPRGAADFLPNGVEVTEVPLRPLWRFLATSFFKAIIVANRWKPDFVVAGSGLTAPAALAASRVIGAKSVAYLHGLDITVSNRMYRTLWHPAIRRANLVIANSAPTARLAVEMGVRDSRLQIVHPGVSIPSAPQIPWALSDFRKRNRLDNKSILLSVGRLTERKGLLEFVQSVLPKIVRFRDDAILVVVGDTPTDSLHANVQSRESIQAAADAAGVGRNVRFLGVVDDLELVCAYESAAVHVFPVREIPGDPEGFGMVAIEAATHGLPTVAFASGGVVDAVGEGESGRLIAQSDFAGFAEAVVQVIAEGREAWSESAKAFAESFSWSEFGRRIALAFQSSDLRSHV